MKIYTLLMPILMLCTVFGTVSAMEITQYANATLGTAPQEIQRMIFDYLVTGKNAEEDARNVKNLGICCKLLQKVLRDEKFLDYFLLRYSDGRQARAHVRRISTACHLATPSAQKLVNDRFSLGISQNCFYFVCRFGEDGFVKRILATQHQLNVNGQGIMGGQTPLMAAVEGQQIPVVKLLLDDNRCNVDAMNDNHETAYHLASRDSSPKGAQIKQLLQEAIVKKRQRDNDVWCAIS